MDEQYIKMCKEARELQDKIEENPDTLYCEGHHVYIKYPVHDEVTGEDSYAVWSWGKRWFKEPLWKPEEIKIPRQEDLQEILKTQKSYTTTGLIIEFSAWACTRGVNTETNHYDHLYEESLSLNVLWLCFTMETIFNKFWNSETKSWELIE